MTIIIKIITIIITIIIIIIILIMIIIVITTILVVIITLTNITQVLWPGARPPLGASSASPGRLSRRTVSPRGFQGYRSKGTVKGPQFEETNTQVSFNRKFLDGSQNG